MVKLSNAQKEFLKSQPVARLVTISKGMPHVVPICYAFDGKSFYIGTDSGAKKVRNIKENENVAIAVDEYFEDWSKLAGVSVQGRAEILEKGSEFENAKELLYKKYPQYKDMPIEEGETAIIKINPVKVKSWGIE